MKNIKKYIAVFVTFIALASCNDDFLERYPLDELTNETFWNSEGDLKAFANGFYTSMGGENVWDDDRSDNQATPTYNSIVAGQHTVDKGNWDWSFLRKCNFFLENYDNNPKLSDEIKNKYKAEVLFFRANHVFGRIKSYGDIPFTTKVLTNLDTEELYAPRKPRKEVMQQVLADLNEASELLPPTNEDGRLTKWAALALKARICLHEGTFRKYHKLGDHQEFITAAAEAAKAVIDGGAHALYSTGETGKDYRDLFVQLDLTSNSEAIFYKIYDGENKGHDFIRYMVEAHKDGLTKDMVNDYLCIDGKPIDLSDKYKGDNTLVDEFSDRDPRLLQTIVDFGADYWADTSNETVPRLSVAKGHGSATTTGYHIHKMYDHAEVYKYEKAETDLHMIRYAEVLLIYAEAMAELDQADQAVIDMTINKLRERVGMPNMVIADLQRDPSSDMIASAGYLDEDVSVLIEEIRRERRIELACEGFRYSDLMRWRAGKMLTKKTLGAKWDAFKDLTLPSGEAQYPGVVVGEDIYVDENGYIDLYQTQLPNGKVFDPNKHYYFSIPLEEIVLNPNLTQNPGW